MSGEAQLEALLEIINASARQAIAEYKKGGDEVPTIHSRTHHPMDFATDNVALKKALRLLEGACQQLCASLAPPQHTAYSFRVPPEWALLHVVVRAQVADVLERHPSGLHVDELAKLVNLEKGKLARVLRFLATKGCFTEIEPNVFANNRISLVTTSSSAVSAIFRRQPDTIIQSAPVLYEIMANSEYETSDRPEMSPAMYARKMNGFNGGFFGSLKEDAEQRYEFHRSMIAVSQVTGSLSVLHYYPWEEVRTVCNIGSGYGAHSLPLLKMHPHLKITDQDLPEVLIHAKDVWAENAPEILQNNRVEFVTLNFLKECPVQAQDVYYLANIIHNWSEVEAATILDNVRKAMAPHSRLLIHGHVLIPTGAGPNVKPFGLDVAPEPMLPNYGNGNYRAHRQDVTMWCSFNAKERTLDEYIELGSAAGLQLEKAYDLGDTVVLDFRVAA